MPVSSEVSVAGPYYPNGATTAFAFDFKAASAGEVVAVDGDDNLISTSLYSVTLDDDEGGTLTFSAAPQASDYPVIYVMSEPELTQSADFDNTGPSFNPAALTRAFDKSAIRDLRLKRDIDRSIKVPFGEGALSLPASASRANRFLAFDADGNVTPSFGTGADAGLREDLAVSGASLVGSDRGVSIETELTDRGAVVDGQSLTTPLILDTGKHHIGRGRSNPLTMGNQASGLVLPQPGGGDFNYFSVTENMFVTHPASFTDSGDYAHDMNWSAYGISWNNKFWGGQIAAVRVRNSVGHMEFDTEAARSPVGHIFEINAGVQNTVHQLYGGTSNIVGTAVQSIGRLDYASFNNRAFDFFNILVANDGPAYNLHFNTCWFEEYGAGTVTFSTSGGRITGYSVGAGDGVLKLGSAKAPRLTKGTFVNPLSFSGGFAPIVDAPHCVAGSCYFMSDGFAQNVFHMRHMTGPNAGTIGVDISNFSLPGYGEAGTLLEHFGVSASHTSLAIAEIAGVGFATGMGHENLYTSEMDGGAWAYKTATLTSGRPDPWGGTTAFAFSGTAGQHYGNFYLPAFDGGGKCCIQFLIRAQAADSKIKLRVESTGVNAFSRQNTYHVTDTRWRIITLRADLPTSGSYTTYIEIVDGTFDIAASQCSAGYDAPPILRGGQSVTGAYTQIDRRIIRQASAIPVTGKYWAGDEIVYPAATANTRKRKGAICTVGDGSGVGTWVEYGFVANVGAAIPDIGGAPTQADHNAVLAVLRAIGAIAP